MIKKANILDLDIVTDLAYQLWPEDYKALKEEMEVIIKNCNTIIALYYFSNNPVAFAQCQLRNDYVEGTNSHPVGYLEGIFVNPNYRKRGIAKELLRYSEAWAREKGCSEFASDCEIENIESYKFHLAMGFIECNRVICFKKDLK